MLFLSLLLLPCVTFIVVNGQGAGGTLEQACTDEYCFCTPDNANNEDCPSDLVGKVYCDESNTNYINLCYSLWDVSIIPYHLCKGSLSFERWSFIKDVNLITEKTLWTCTDVNMCNNNIPTCAQRANLGSTAGDENEDDTGEGEDSNEGDSAESSTSSTISPMNGCFTICAVSLFLFSTMTTSLNVF